MSHACCLRVLSIGKNCAARCRPPAAAKSTAFQEICPRHAGTPDSGAKSPADQGPLPSSDIDGHGQAHTCAGCSAQPCTCSGNCTPNFSTPTHAATACPGEACSQFLGPRTVQRICRQVCGHLQLIQNTSNHLTDRCYGVILYFCEHFCAPASNILDPLQKT